MKITLLPATKLNIVLNHNITDPFLEKQNSSNISLIKEKLNSLAREKN